MGNSATGTKFKAALQRPAGKEAPHAWAFVVLPQEVSATFPRRGRTTAECVLNGYDFVATLEPDGQQSHWLRIEAEWLEAAGAAIGAQVTLTVKPAPQEREPVVPADFAEALAQSPEARAVWMDTTTIARVDWIHWITSAKQTKTRTKRISDACHKLASGKRRVCCFDPSGYYSKAFTAPKPAESRK